MAIKKLTEFQSGYTAEYYQLARIEWNKGSAMLVTFNVFKDKQARLDNKLPLTQVTVQLDVAPDSVMQSTYTAIMALMEGSEEV